MVHSSPIFDEKEKRYKIPDHRLHLANLSNPNTTTKLRSLFEEEMHSYRLDGGVITSTTLFEDFVKMYIETLRWTKISKGGIEHTMEIPHLSQRVSVLSFRFSFTRLTNVNSLDKIIHSKDMDETKSKPYSQHLSQRAVRLAKPGIRLPNGQLLLGTRIF